MRQPPKARPSTGNEMVNHGQKMDKEKDYKVALAKINILPTLRINYETLHALGIGEDVIWYLKVLHLHTLFEFDSPTYLNETRQFISTVMISYPKCKHHIAQDGVLRFTIDEKVYWLSIPQLGRSLGFEYHDAIDFGSFSRTDF